MSHVDPATIGAEIESLIRKMGALGDSQARAQARELMRLLMSLYGAGLSRMLEIVRTEGGGPQAVLDRLASDPLLASLLVLHDLHPHPIDSRVQRALMGLRPHLPADTHLTLVAVDNDSVRLKVEQSADGQARSAGTIRLAIERAIQEAAPEVGAIQIDGLDDPPSPSVHRASGFGEASALIQIVRPSLMKAGEGCRAVAPPGGRGAQAGRPVCERATARQANHE